MQLGLGIIKAAGLEMDGGIGVFCVEFLDCQGCFSQREGGLGWGKGSLGGLRGVEVLGIFFETEVPMSWVGSFERTGMG